MIITTAITIELINVDGEPMGAGALAAVSLLVDSGKATIANISPVDVVAAIDGVADSLFLTNGKSAFAAIDIPKRSILRGESIHFETREIRANLAPEALRVEFIPAAPIRAEMQNKTPPDGAAAGGA